MRGTRWGGLVALACAAVIALVGLTMPSASAANACTLKVTKLYKSGGNVIGVMNMSCSSRKTALHIKPVFVRTGGGHASQTIYKPETVCTATTSCTATVGVADVSGSEDYWFTTDPGGTFVIGGATGSSRSDCSGGISCESRNGTF